MKEWMEDGSVVALVLVGAVAAVGFAAKRSQHDNPVRLVSQQQVFVGSSNRGSRAMRYTDFVAAKMPELVASGMKAPDAMKQAARMWRER